MDMKRILQAMDGVATKPVAGVNDMAKFLRVVSEVDLNQTEAVGDPANITDQVNSYIQYSSGLYQKGASSIEIKKGLVLPITFTPIPPSGDSFKIIQANLNAANARLPKELQLSPDQLSTLVGGADKPYAGISANTPYTGPTLNEGANPHKVALPVQMAMQHYQEVSKATTTPITEKKSSIKTFFKEVQLEAEEEQLANRQLRNQYAQQIAERVLMKENTDLDIPIKQPTVIKDPKTGKIVRSNKQSDMAIPNIPGTQDSMGSKDVPKGPAKIKGKNPDAQWDIRNKYKVQQTEENVVPGHTAGFNPGPGPGLMPNTSEMAIAANPADANNPMIHSHEKANSMHLKDRIAMARAQLRELAQLAESNELVVWEKITRLSKGGMFMGLEQNLEQIRHGISELARKRKQGGVASRGIEKNIGEAVMPTIKPAKPKTIKPKTKTSTCRAGQTQTGMQTKNGKQVPKCSIKPSLAENVGLPFGLDKPVFPEFPYYTWWDFACDLGVVAAVYTAGTAVAPVTVGASEAAAIAVAAPRMMKLAKVLEKIVYAIRLLLPDVQSILKAVRKLVKMNTSELKAFLQIAGSDGVKAALINIGINFGISKIPDSDTEPAPKKDLSKSASFANTGGGAATGNPNITNQKK
jgi:hypothetical protein